MSTSPNPPAAAIDASTPLLLLPVHIQMRFIDNADGSSALLVRVYPDQISIDSHERELTAQEVSDGQAYWDAVWRAGNPPPRPDDAKAPWRNLASRYGPPRAAWIALQLTPSNLSKQPVAPTPAGAAPAPLPVYPAVATRATSWERPAIADALPDAWTVVLVSGGKTSVHRGSPIIKPLHVSLSPRGGGFPAGLSVDAGLQWMTDFPTAVAAGMALPIALTPAERAAGFDQLFVYGLRAGDPDPAQTFVNVLDAHHYTDGLSFLPQGAPTNNTPDAASIYSRKDTDFEFSFQTERDAPLTANAACDGVAFASFTGIAPATFDHVSHADQTGSVNSSDMLAALWPSTMGYFLSQMMAPAFTPAQVEEVRKYALANVRPRGPVPAFRAGAMPYGVLPVTSLFQYASPAGGGSVEAELAAVLRALWSIWLSSSSRTPQIRPGVDADDALMSVLGMDASSMTFRGRAVLGDIFLWNFLHFLGVPGAFQARWFQHLSAPARALLDQLGFATLKPRLEGLGFADRSFPVHFPTVQVAPLSETDRLAQDADLGSGTKGNYIQWLQTASVADIQAENYPGTKPDSLLYKMLRQSLLALYASLAGAAEVKAGKLTVAQIQENEIVGADPVAKTLTPWQLLARPSVPNPQLNWAEYLSTTRFAAGTAFAQLSDFRASLGRLAALPTAELDRLLTETLDVCSHRLDAWATGIATALLQRTRAAQNHAVGLGCYGWVEEIRPESGRAAVQGKELDAVRRLDALRAHLNAAASLPAPLEPVSENGGYIYAPSPAQAAAAAVLRNGFMTHKNSGSEGLLSIDLSSERVDRAMGLIRGVQRGQSLNALLGYLFEDALSERGLQKYIQPFRNAHPVVGDQITPASAPGQALSASNVVDGLALRTAWDAGQYPVGANWGPGLPPAGADQQSATAVLEALDDYADALGDLSMADAVFQIVRGNFERGSALMDAMSRGSRPPDPDIVKTPTGGIDLTHRVLLLFAGPVSPADSWRHIPRRARAAAEPSLDAWVSLMLPDPATVRCRVSYVDGAGHAGSATVALRDLNVGPLDLLSLAEAAETPQRSELESRILFAAALPAGAHDAQILFDAAGLPPGSLLFPDVLFVAQSLRELIGSSRSLDPQDMTTPETDAAAAGGTVVLGDLRSRATAALHTLAGDVAALGAAATPDAIRTALHACSYYGVSGAIPNTRSGSDAGLERQKASVAAILAARVAEASRTNLATATIADLQAVFRAIFGPEFRVLPSFVPPRIAELHQAFSRSDSLVAGDSQATTRWFRQAAYTHPGVSRLDLALSTAQALGAAAYPPKLVLAQVPPPRTLPDRWLALPIDRSKPPEKGRVAFDCVVTGHPETAANYAGLMVDEWPERIPDAQGTAAVAFHFDEPGARAPNAVLLAVSPRQQAAWDDTLLQAILAEALQLAKIRSVDLASVGAVGQILPALYFALNLQGATISTRFANVRG